MKRRIFFLFIGAILFINDGYANKMKTDDYYSYLGKCSWDHTFNFEYSEGYALAEFFLHKPTGVVFVHNYIDEEGGDFRNIPELPRIELLQEAGEQGLRNYTWDNGDSEVSFAGRPLNQVLLATSTKNKLGSNGNVYAPCYFIAE